jgi:chloramphenicol 3-O-phosphotransferase
VADAVKAKMEAFIYTESYHDSLTPANIVIVDAVRIPDQIGRIRELGYRVLHVHVSAPTETLLLRWRERGDERAGGTSYVQAKANEIESRVPLMSAQADMVIDTGYVPFHEYMNHIVTALRISELHARTVDVLIGGQYGSEGFACA